jgi:hypothetical protein
LATILKRISSPLNLMLGLLWVSFLIPGARARENYYPDSGTALRAWAPDGVTPLASIGISDNLMGRAFVYGGSSPDLFLRGDRWFPEIYLYRYLNRKDGVPVFGQPVRVQPPPGIKGSTSGMVYQDAHGDVLGLWLVKKDFTLARYNKNRHCFEPIAKDEVKESCEQTWARSGSGEMTRVEFDSRPSGFIGGSRYGNLPFYTMGTDQKPTKIGYAVGLDGILLRTPTTGAKPLAYPGADGHASDLIVSGEGGIFYYRFTGRFDQRKQPVYAGPAPLLERNAPLAHSTLPVINSVDWDGDGGLDIISGDSVGFVSLIENVGSVEAPRFRAPVHLRAGTEIIRIRSGYYGSLQGPGEANWGYTSPTVVDWNSDGLPDIVMSDATATHKVYLNRGTRKKPKLAPAKELFCDGLDLHGAWRVKPGLGLLNGKMAYVLIDDDQEFHLFWRIDDQNLEDGGKLHLESGAVIVANYRSGGNGGRVKIALFDWDHDGRNDLLLTTHSGNSIPDPKYGVPHEAGAMVLLMLNVSQGEKIGFASPRPLQYKGRTLYLGEHACSAAPFPFGKDKYGMLVAIENGRFYLLPPEDISWGAPPVKN